MKTKSPESGPGLTGPVDRAGGPHRGGSLQALRPRNLPGSICPGLRCRVPEAALRIQEVRGRVGHHRQDHHGK